MLAASQRLCGLNYGLCGPSQAQLELCDGPTPPADARHAEKVCRPQLSDIFSQTCGSSANGRFLRDASRRRRRTPLVFTFFSLLSSPSTSCSIKISLLGICSPGEFTNSLMPSSGHLIGDQETAIPLLISAFCSSRSWPTSTLGLPLLIRFWVVLLFSGPVHRAGCGCGRAC